VNIKLGAQEQMLDGGDLVEKFKFARAVGFDGIELRGAGDGKFAERREELRAARRAGVIISSVCVMMDHFIGDFDAERRSDAIENMKILLSLIADAGGVGAVTPAAFGMFSRRLPPFQPPRSEAEDRKVLLEGLFILGEHASKAGALVLLEPLNRFEDHMVNTLDQAASLVGELGMASVAVIADTFHMSIEEKDVGASLRQHRDVVKHIQLGDSNRLEPGAGHYDWSETIRALSQIDYGGWMVMECGLSGPPAQVLPGVAQLLRGVAGQQGAHTSQ
jgi:sugar phosphate isomerase/epimerase